VIHIRAMASPTRTLRPLLENNCMMTSAISALAIYRRVRSQMLANVGTNKTQGKTKIKATKANHSHILD
jgi:hypothetical protein